MVCGIAGGEPAFSAQKTRSRSQKERNRKWELWTLLFFSKNFIEVWLIFSVALSSSAQQCDSVIHIKTIQSFKNVYSFSWGLSLDNEYSSLRSTVGLFFFFLSFCCIPNSQSSPPQLPSSWQQHALSHFGWTLTSPAAHKSPWYLPKEGNKTKNCAGSEY